MKYVVIGKPSGLALEDIMKVYPRHVMVIENLMKTGDIIGIGPFTDFGNMAIFKSRETAERYMREDPFILEGIVVDVTLHEWRDSIESK
ncbi:MAG: YciI family protein [Chitinophagales bacterium]